MKALEVERKAEKRKLRRMENDLRMDSQSLRIIVDLIADTFELDGAMLHLLDEAKANWVRDVLGELMPHQIVNLDTYVHHLGKVMRLVGLHGNGFPTQTGDVLARDRRLPPTERKALEILDARDHWTKAEIRKQYKSLVKDLHPDMNGGDRSQEEQLQEVVWAWDQIKDSRNFK